MITINGKSVEFKKGQTVLEAATDAGLYIPTLCTHPELEPFGACRMCIVKIENMRGYPPACTTPVTDEMVITTEDEELQELRRNVLEMLLSEHPNTCIICEDREQCEECHIGPTKAGRVTGCRFCPNKVVCEVREVSDYLGLKELRLPLSYKNIPMERDDPFFDRDYNLCILCGRCVRVCQDIRGAGTIAFTQRSSRNRIGTAFNKLHIDTNCGFCGACVDVCPTGALSARGSKWYGDADSCIESVCMLCSVGCTFKFETKWDRIMAALPSEEGPTRGQACSRGRFCIPPLLNGPDRLKQPMIKMDGNLVPVSWEDAIAYAAENLAKYGPEDLEIMASQFLTNESAYVLQKFARKVLKTDNIDIVDSKFITAVFNTLLESGAAISDEGKIASLEDSNWIIILGNTLFNPPNALIPSVFRAKKRGAKVVHITDKESKILPKLVDISHTMSLSETLHLFYGILHKLIEDNPDAKKIEGYDAFTESLEGIDEENVEELSDEIDEVFEELGPGKGSIIFDDSILALSNPEALVKGIMDVVILSNNPEGFIPYYQGGNAQGVCDMGALAGFRPWHKAGTVKERGKAKALYLTEGLPLNKLGEPEFLIVQDIYPSEAMDRADVIFPACAFTEDYGTVTSFERRLQPVKKAVNPPGSAWPDWKIISELAQKMGAKGFNYKDTRKILKESKKKAPNISDNGIWTFKDRPLTLLSLETGDVEETKQGEPDYKFRGADLLKRIEDFRLQIERGGAL